MKTISPSANRHQFPRQGVESVKCRSNDLVIRITDWTKDKEEPAYDVECYIGGVYDNGESESFVTKSANRSKKEAKALAIAFAQKQIEKLL